MRQRLAFLVLAGAVLAGCLMAFPAPKAISPVYTDWSKLTDYQPMEALYETFEPYAGDHLTARDDYGPLLRYMGAAVFPENFPYPTPLYGLMTTNGRVVTDPVYTDVFLTGTSLAGKPSANTFLILRIGNADQGSYLGDIFDKGARTTVAASDGSWVLEGDYNNWRELEDHRLALTGLDSSVTIIDDTGSILVEFPREALMPYLGEAYYWAWDGGIQLQWLNGIGCVWQAEEYEKDPANYQYSLYLNPDNGSISRQPPEGFSFEWQPEDYYEDTRKDFPGYRNADPLTDPFTGALYYRGLREGDDWVIDMLDETGGLLVESCETGFTYPSWVWNELIAKVDHDVFSYYDLNGNCVFRYPLRSNTD